jgi:hypothetical protein
MWSLLLRWFSNCNCHNFFEPLILSHYSTESLIFTALGFCFDWRSVNFYLCAGKQCYTSNKECQTNDKSVSKCSVPALLAWDQRQKKLPSQFEKQTYSYKHVQCAIFMVTVPSAKTWKEVQIKDSIDEVARLALHSVCFTHTKSAHGLQWMPAWATEPASSGAR